MGPPVGKLPFQLRPALNLRRQIVRNHLQFPHELSNLQLQVLRQPPRSLYVTVRLLVADAFSSPLLHFAVWSAGWARVETFQSESHRAPSGLAAFLYRK